MTLHPILIVAQSFWNQVRSKISRFLFCSQSLCRKHLYCLIRNLKLSPFRSLDNLFYRRLTIYCCGEFRTLPPQSAKSVRKGRNRNEQLFWAGYLWFYTLPYLVKCRL